MNYDHLGEISADYLEHYGILGMKWGVRRTPEQLGRVETMRHNIPGKNKEISLEFVDAPNFTKLLSRIIPSVKKQINKELSFRIKDTAGNKVGNFFAEHVSDSELNLNWLDISKKERGKKYAQSSMQAMIDAARDSGYKILTLEVPTNSPDARHIYEKLGFKPVDGKINYDEDDVWEGLTAMELDLTKLQHSVFSTNYEKQRKEQLNRIREGFSRVGEVSYRAAKAYSNLRLINQIGLEGAFMVNLAANRLTVTGQYILDGFKNKKK